MKITIVAGARPNFMKIAPITRAIEAARALGKSISYRLVYTGRKDDTSLDASLFSDLDMKAPDVYLGVESSNPTSLTAGIMVAFEQELTENPAHVVLVVDDLTATMSCAIVAKKQGIKVAHLVAGTRSFDMKMPKEVNRMITDGLSDYLFTAGMVANRNLNQTGTESENVHSHRYHPLQPEPFAQTYMVFRIGAARGKLSLAHPQPSRIAKQQRESASVAENNH